MNHFRKLILLAFFLLCQHLLFAQYILNGSAEKNSCNCYTLTQPSQFQTGSVWNSNKINLNTAFDFWFNVYLGCGDDGADGMVFILQPISTSVGTAGGGMGFEGVNPSIGIAMDTYQNPTLGDPVFDHISIQANGVVNHSNDLAGPVSISSTTNNVEDCQWHKLRITWDAATKWLRTYFDGVLRVEKQIDLVSTIFNNDPNVFWGFTGATGGSVNLQQFCTALDPIFTTNFTNNIACEGEQVVFTNASESFTAIANYNWNFGDGSFSTSQNPPPHLYAAPGTYQVNLKIIGMDGCEKDSTKMITIASPPSADLAIYDTCLGNTPRLNFVANNTGISFQWQVDGAPVTGNQQPSLTGLPSGNHRVDVIATSDFGCGAPDSAEAEFLILPIPASEAFLHDGCITESIQFNGVQTDTGTTISEWVWGINNNIFTGQVLQQSFSEANDYPIKLWVKATNGCFSDTVEKVIKITKAFVSANDTTIIRNHPTQLNATGNGSFAWSPSIGLSSPNISTPIASLNNDQNYLITVITPEGCSAEKFINVKVFNGPSIYVPTAFTPNGDGKNELLLPVYVGIKELKQFSVFNRWGQMVFTTNNRNKGWEGNDLAGTYVWVINAVNYLGQPLLLKGTVTIIR